MPRSLMPRSVRIKLPAKFDRNKVKLDNIVEIWSGHVRVR